MLNQLPTLRTGVNHNPVTFRGNSLLFRQLFGDLNHMRYQRSLLIGDIVKSGDVLPGDN
jgi:hypothetical protein